MTPKIIFKYSWIYDKNLREWVKNYEHIPKKNFTIKEIEKYIKDIKKLWRNQDNKIPLQRKRNRRLCCWKMHSFFRPINNADI